jgi:hypothetical protein
MKLLLGLAAWLFLLAWGWMAAAVPPTNDSCGSATVLSLATLPVHVSGSTLEAIDNGRSVGCPGQTGGRDVVYRFTTPGTMDLVIDTEGSVFDTVLSLWSACSVDGLQTEIACNDDFNGVASRLDLYQLPAGTYYILVDGFDISQSGIFFLNLSAPSSPANDLCGNALSIPLNSTIYGSTLGADNSQQEFCGLKLTDGPDVFYSFQTPDAIDVRIDTLGSDLDTVITVLEQDCAGNVIACSDDFDGTKQSQVTLLGTVPGFNYIIRVDSDISEAGAFRLNVYEVQPPPANDVCSGALPVIALPSVQTGSTEFADHFDSSPTVGGSGPDVAFRIDLSQSGDLVLDSEGTQFDSVLYVRSGTCSGPEVGSNDDSLGRRTSRLVLAALPAGTYYAILDGKTVADRGDYVLSISSGFPPSNDTCASAEQIPVPALETGSMRLAIDDTNSTAEKCASSGPDVVFRFTLAEPRQLEFSTLGSQFDTVLYLRSDDCGSVANIACNDDGSGSFGITSFIDDFASNPLPAGSYHLFLDSLDATDGDFTIQIIDLSTPTPVPTTTATGTRTSSPTPGPSGTETSTPTKTPSATFTATSSQTFTPGPSPSFTLTPSITASFTVTDTPTEGPSPTVTETPSVTSTPSQISTSTETPLLSDSPTPSSTGSLTGVPTQTATGESPTPTPTHPPNGDLDGDSFVGPIDLLLFLAQWGNSGSGNPADFNLDGKVDSEDLRILSLYWSAAVH